MGAHDFVRLRRRGREASSVSVYRSRRVPVEFGIERGASAVLRGEAAVLGARAHDTGLVPSPDVQTIGLGAEESIGRQILSGRFELCEVPRTCESRHPATFAFQELVEKRSRN
jgi:hypothetical protein